MHRTSGSWQTTRLGQGNREWHTDGRGTKENTGMQGAETKGTVGSAAANTKIRREKMIEIESPHNDWEAPQDPGNSQHAEDAQSSQSGQIGGTQIEERGH